MAEAPPREDESEAPQGRPVRKRSRTIRDRWWHRALASVFLGLCSAFAWMPGFLAYGIADAMALPWALFWLCSDPRGRRSRGYHRNVRIVFRKGSAMERRPPRHLWRWSRHMAWLFVDFCRMRRLRADNLERHVDLAEVPQLAALMAEGRGVIVATGHIGMWDVLGHAAGLVGVPLTSVYRPSYVPALDRAVEKLRSGTGQALLLREGAIGPLKQALAEGQMLGLLVDGGGKGSRTFAPFLGTRAATTASPALLHLVTGAPVAVVTCERKGRMRWRVRVWDVVRDGRTGDRRAALQAITDRLNRALSAAILAAPEQWFWQNNRFRHRPPGEAPGPDGLPPVAPA